MALAQRLAARLEQLGVAQDQRQGRAQLVAEQGQHLALERLQLLVGAGARVLLGAQRGAAAGHQLGGVERLSEVVHAAGSQAEHFVLRGAARAEEQYGDRRLALAELRAQVQAAALGQHDVQHDQVGDPLGQHALGLGHVRRGADRHALQGEVVVHEAPQVCVVVYHQDAW
jgi:hypothetical protein